MKPGSWCALVLLALAVGGCATDSAQKSFTRDGAEYGVTEGRFRGRWWNYYERGSSYLDGQFYAEAEADLRTAIAQRTADQRWARTYGLHFTPEYFPNRELGIALYGQDRIEESIPYLETSLEQTYSARAAYYLDEARRAWVNRAGNDTEAPAIRLVSPDTSSPLASSVIRVAAIATDDTFISRIEIDGRNIPFDVSAPRVEFETELELQPGQNGFTIKATDLTGKTTVYQVAFTADLDGPAISFDSPVTLPGTLSGVLYDPSGVDSLTIGGAVASLSKLGEVTQFQIALSREELKAPLRFQCTDVLGNVTRGRVPVETFIVSESMPDFALASLRTVKVSDRLNAIYAGDRPVAIQLAQAALDGPVAEFTNLEDGQRYLMDEIVVSVRLASNEAIKGAKLNGVAIDGLVPGRKEQRISRRVRLSEEGANEITVEIEDVSGRIAIMTVTVERELTAIEKLDARLSVAILGNVWTGSTPATEGEAQYLLDELTQALYERDRFLLVTRDELPEIIQERELIAALGDDDARSALGAIIPSEILVIGKIRRSIGSIEIILQAIDPSSSRIIGYADVAGPGDTADNLSELASDLAIRFEQEFPRIQGQVIEARSATRLTVDLTELDGLRNRLKCIVFRRGEEIIHPETGDSLGTPIEILGQGYFDNVRADLSTILFTPSEGESVPEVVATDFVLLK